MGDRNMKRIAKRRHSPVNYKKDDEITPTKRRRIADSNVALQFQTANSSKGIAMGRENIKQYPEERNRVALPVASECDENKNQNRTNNSKEHKVSGYWEVHQLLAEVENIDEESSRNIVNLFENENTVPFICRYRRDLISKSIDAEKLRQIKIVYNDLLCLRKRAENCIKSMERDGHCHPDIQQKILCARTTDEIEFLYNPYKPARKGTLAERAKALGLEKYAKCILTGTPRQIHLPEIVDQKNAELDSEDKVTEGICHILLEMISKDTEILAELKRLKAVHKVIFSCSRAKLTKSSENKASSRDDVMKFENYFDFQTNVEFIKPHQILAINRGEKLKILSSKLNFLDKLKNDLKIFAKKLYQQRGYNYPLRVELFERSFEECYKKRFQPFLSRQIRGELDDTASKASVQVFARNLKQLLLTSPLKGECILGIDPGFANGCKLALISKTAEVLATDVLYPHRKSAKPVECGERLANMLRKHNCTTIALGNGTACRETEKWLTELFKEKVLNEREIRYSVVSEQGASIYSCSEIAKREFPNMDVNLISAVSIARRLNDPLSEYVKVEPKHLGVGMYQHDVREKLLSETLDEVVTECVSFVGVDINTASLCVLKHIAGLSLSKAEKIIEYRSKNGPFFERRDLLNVKTIGEKTFVQCAGFIRIEPLSISGKVKNILDCTWVHPESYNVARSIIAKCNQQLSNLGQPNFITSLEEFSSTADLDNLSKEYLIPKERLLSVLEALQRPLLSDFRNILNKKPLFKKGITKLSDLKEGTVVTGSVSNITHFGAFVDIGVEKDGLIHSSKMKGAVLNIGDHVEAVVNSIDVRRQRIQLNFNDFAT